MAMPLLVTVISAVIGNILGYTVFKDVAAGLYYNSYSLPTYVTLWNADAFVLTTVVPLILMAAVFMIASLVKLPVRYAFAGVAVIALLFSCTPLNVVDIPNRNQEHRLEQALTEAGILSGSQINENVKLSDEARAKVASPYQYLRDSGDKKSELFNELAKTKLARNRSMSDTIRFLIIEGMVYNIDYSHLIDCNVQLGKIGTNLNQIAYKINKTGSIYRL
jgi:hypothetical protein